MSKTKYAAEIEANDNNRQYEDKSQDRSLNVSVYGREKEVVSQRSNNFNNS